MPEKPSITGCTCFRVRRLARRVTQVYDRALAPVGLKVTQFSLLALLHGEGPLAMTTLAARLDMDRTTLTRNLQPLAERGWVEVRPDPVDARQRLVSIVDAGRERLREARALRRKAQSELNERVGAAEVAALHDLVDGLLETLNRSAEAA